MKKPRVAKPEVMKHVQHLIMELVAEGRRIVYTESKRPPKTGQGGLGPMHVMMDKDPRSGSLGMYQSNTNKPIMGQNYGRPWKHYKDSGY